MLKDLGAPNDREIVVCPPYTALHALSTLLQNTPIALGAQDVFYAEQGAYTGAVSPLMLRDLGVAHVIVGHSERRQIFGEDDALVNRKVQAALTHGLDVICASAKPSRSATRARLSRLSSRRCARASRA